MNFFKNILRLMVFISTCFSCKRSCEDSITIYEGVYFEAGQSYELYIENELIEKEHFNRKIMRGQSLNKIDSYCCKNDSCNVKFILDDQDTTFYISPAKTKRLYIGSDINGDFSVSTDENKDSWIRM